MASHAWHPWLAELMVAPADFQWKPGVTPMSDFTHVLVAEVSLRPSPLAPQLGHLSFRCRSMHPPRDHLRFAVCCGTLTMPVAFLHRSSTSLSSLGCSGSWARPTPRLPCVLPLVLGAFFVLACRLAPKFTTDDGLPTPHRCAPLFMHAADRKEGWGGDEIRDVRAQRHTLLAFRGDVRWGGI
jgi:hypothetical protein